MNIILTGFMGTGKTSAGKRLAKRLGWTFVDVDDLIEASAKKPIAHIFAEHGEPVFRRLERRHIGRVIRGDHQVVATGGGAFVDPRNRTRLRATGVVVCLTARPEVILKRANRSPGTRPLLAGTTNPLGRVRRLLAVRAKAYRQADLVLDTSTLSVEETVERLWKVLSPHICPSWEYLLGHAPALTRRYAGKYVAIEGQRVIACGQTQLEAYRKASARLRTGSDTGIYYIPLPEESLTAF